MKEYLSLVVVLLIASFALFCQWLRIDDEADLLNARMYSLQRDLAKIHKVRNKFPAFREEISKTEQLIGILQKRLPSEPCQGAFIEQVIEGFTAKNVEMVFDHSDTVDKEFHKEIKVVFHYDHEELENSVIREVFQDMDRLAQWENNKQDKILVTKIYSSHQDMDPDMLKIKSCGNIARDNLTYWPFNKVIKSKMEQVEKLCSMRNNNQSLYAEIKLLEHRRKSLQILTIIVEYFDPEN